MNFIKTFTLPMCWIFLIPILSYLFIDYAIEERNDQINNIVFSSSESKEVMSEYEYAQLKASFNYFNYFDYAETCNQQKPEYQTIITTLGSLCDDFYYYKVGSELSFYSILISVVMIILTLGLFFLSFRTQVIQYICFVVAWNISKLFCMVQILMQGVLLLGVCYLGTLLIWNTYYPQILFLIGIPVAIACIQMISVLVSRAKEPNYIVGQLLTPKDSPLLYEELMRICEKFETDLPNNIVLGIEDNFFVTENELLLNWEELLIGKTLYVSIFHLKKLDKQEASAIFAHEMAHFSGEDTFFSKKTMPKLAKCDDCFAVLNMNVVTIPASYFLMFFRGLFEISFGKISRMREYRADAMAAEYVGAKALSNGLVKFVFYSEYRANIEDDLILKSERVESINFLKQIEDGVHHFATNYSFEDGILEQSILHPFDSHPPIYKRINAVGYTLDIEDVRNDVLTNEEDSWYHEINNAQLIEAELMKGFEDDFISAHEENLLYQFIPSTDEETELVEKHFPPVVINSKNKKETLWFNCKTFKYSTWEREITYDEIESYSIKKPLFRKKRMAFKLKKSSDLVNGKRKMFFPVKRFAVSEDEVVDTFSRYYLRYTIAADFQDSSV
jgi:Zn-dependent protease with chaperone function